MKHALLALICAVSLCGGALFFSGCAGGYVGVDAGPGYYDDGPYVYGGGWWHEGGWHHGWAQPGFHRW